MKKFFLFFVLTICTAMHLMAQRQGKDRIDSLLDQLPKAKEDTNKVKLLIDLSHTYYSINPDEGINFGKKELALLLWA